MTPQKFHYEYAHSRDENILRWTMIGMFISFVVLIAACVVVYLPLLGKVLS